MSGVLTPGENTDSVEAGLEPTPRRWIGPSSPTVRAVLLYIALGLGLGALAGLVWWRVTGLVAFTISSDSRAIITERGYTGFFAGDAWFCLIGAVVGIVLGLLAWRRFRDLGWPLPLISVGTALAAALICWLVGYQLGPGDFTHRIATARPGEMVPIALTLRAPVSLLVWPFLAVVPVLLGASLGHDAEEIATSTRRRRRRESAATVPPSE